MMADMLRELKSEDDDKTEVDAGSDDASVPLQRAEGTPTPSNDNETTAETPEATESETAAEEDEATRTTIRDTLRRMLGRGD